MLFQKYRGENCSFSRENHEDDTTNTTLCTTIARLKSTIIARVANERLKPKCFCYYYYYDYDYYYYYYYYKSV